MKRNYAAFFVGFLLTVTAFILLNAYTYYAGSTEFNARTFHFSHSGFYWGFPFPWLYKGTCHPCDLDNWFTFFGFWANVGVGLTVSVFAGFAGKFAIRKLYEETKIK